MIRVYMKVEGHVQGVGFRYFTQLKAAELGINGWVKNGDDGSVEIEAEADKNKINAFISHIQKGTSPFSKVEQVHIEHFETPAHYQSFSVKY